MRACRLQCTMLQVWASSLLAVMGMKVRATWPSLLTGYHSTVAVQHFNQSIDNVIRINGSDDYDRLLQRLSQSIKLPESSLIDRWRRKLNKRLGYPATADVGTISGMLTSLRTAAEHHLGSPLDRVVVTAPQFPALTSQDIKDAIENAGLRSWLVYPFPYPAQLYTLNAAYAANGRGQCTNWRDVYACWDEVEEGELLPETVLGLTLTDTMLLMSLSRIDYAFEKTPDRHLASTELGHGSLTAYPSPEAYWSAVTEQLKEFIVDMQKLGKKMTEIVLTGEHGAVPEILTALQEALASANPIKVSQLADPMWAASRGAAMYARIRHEVPWNCSLASDCGLDQSYDVANDEL